MAPSLRTAALPAVLLLVLVGCATPPATPDASESASSTPVLDDAVRAELDDGFAEAVVATGMPGAAAYVSIGDDVWTRSVGVGDVDTDELYDSDAVVRIGSVTKTFVGTVALQLIDEERMSLEDLVEKYIPGITNGDRITVRDLLSMTSGIWEFTGDAELMARWSVDPVMPWTVDDTIQLIKGKPAQFEPGEKVIYTDSNYILLGRIVELVSGESLRTQIDQRVIGPLGLTATAMPASSETGMPEPHQQGYRPVGNGVTKTGVELVPISDINPDVAWAAGSMTSTLDDLVVWAEALADGGLISPELQAARVDTDYADGSNMQYGLAVQRFGDLIGHGGAIFGYNTTMFRIPELDATIVITGNGSSNGSGGTLDLLAKVLQSAFPDQLEKLTQ